MILFYYYYILYLDESQEKIKKGGIKMKDVSKLPKEEREIILAKREYYRQWRKANADKVKQHNDNYWKKKAAETNKAANN